MRKLDKVFFYDLKKRVNITKVILLKEKVLNKHLKFYKNTSNNRENCLNKELGMRVQLVQNNEKFVMYVNTGI